MKTRFMALLVALVMILSVATVAMAEDVTVYDVDWLNCWNGSSANWPDDLNATVAGKYVLENFGLNFNTADTAGQSEYDYINLLFSSGSVPDVVSSPYWGIGAGQEGQVALDGAIECMVKDLTPYLDNYPNLKALFDKENGYLATSYRRNMMNNPEFDGEDKVFFLPTGVNMNSEEYSTVYGDTLYVRADIAEALGVDPQSVTNTDELVDFLRKVAESDLTDWNGNKIIPLGTGHDGWRNANIFNGIMNALTPSRDHVTLHNTGGVEANDRMMLENCLKDGCTGILYYPGIGSAPPLDLLIQMAANGYPCMLMDKRQPDVKLPCVQADNVAAARKMTEYLIRKGHRKIAFAITTYTSSVYERYTGFCEAMQQAGADMNSQLCYSVDEARRRGENMEDLIRTLLDRGVTAVFCSADQPARDMIDACRRMGVQTPDQLAIVGFDGVYPGEITSMLQPYAQIGLTATQLLLDWILTGRVDRSVTCLEAKMLLGKSTEGAEFVE